MIVNCSHPACRRELLAEDSFPCPHGIEFCGDCTWEDACEDCANSVVAEPGLWYSMDDTTYHADPVPGGSLSSTFARLLTNNVPAKAEAIRRNRKPTKAMNVGKAAHLLALGTGPRLVTWQYDGRTKAGKAERAELAAEIASEAVVAVTEDERDRIEGMAAALQAEPEIRDLLAACETEVSGFWTENGVWCRARYDILTDAAPWDYKTAEDASARGFERAMENYGYHQQAEFYRRGLRALDHPGADAPMRFIVQETFEPYLIQIHVCDPLAIEVAAALNDRALSIYEEAQRTGIWPGFPDLHAKPTELTARYFYRHADAIPALLNPYADPEMSM